MPVPFKFIRLAGNAWQVPEKEGEGDRKTVG
jgi:hypothetical protein